MANVDGQKPPPETLNMYTLFANWGFTVLTDHKPANNVFTFYL